MSNPPLVRTVDRLVRILDSFSPERPTWSLAELSVHLGLPKSTLHRFLVSMESYGILRRDAGDKRWRLGYRLFIWGNLAAETTELRHIARPIMRDLVAATGETVILTVYQEQEVICIEKVETNYPVRLTLDVGTHRPPHAGASSKVLMAYLPQEEIQVIIRDKGLPKLCINTITDPDELTGELARIRERGYAVSHEETDLGAWGVATPISDWKGNVIAAVGIAGPRSRFDDELVQEYVRLCRQAARRISALLGAGIEP
ncbi:MAG: IclR family transcriptional regulator [Anaerolineae bacterium]